MERFYRSAEELCEEMASAVDGKYSAAKGTWLWEILKAVSIGLSEITKELEELSKKFYYKELKGDELDDYVENWSYITRKKAAYANGYVTFKAKETRTGSISEGVYVSKGNIRYVTVRGAEITEPGGSVELPVECCDIGEAGNCEPGEINRLITSLDFVESVGNRISVTGGSDREGDDELRARYEKAMKKTANAGNKAYYEELAESVSGVGAAFCISCPGRVAGTADLYILNTDMNEAAEDKIEEVQNFIDPNRNGDGAGEAAVGAVVTVKTPIVEKINVEAELVMNEGYSAEGARQEAFGIIEEYLREAFSEGIVRYNRIGKCILETEGVRDFLSLKVNGGTENLSSEGLIKLYRLQELVLQ